MKTALNQNFVLRLTLAQKPVSGDNGQLTFESNPAGTPYIVFDDHREAPTGFGVKVAKTKKTYIIQRRINGGKVVKAKVGNISDFTNIDVARRKARDLIDVAKDTGRNPNAVARDKVASEITIGEAFAVYRAHLLGRSKPAKQNTLKVFDKALDRLSGWEIDGLKILLGRIS